MMMSDVCLSVCLSCTSGLSREQRGLGRPKLAQTRTPLSMSKSKVKDTRPLCSPPCWRRQAAAVGVGTCWPWETAATLPSARRRKALRRPRGEMRGHIVAAARLQLVNLSNCTQSEAVRGTPWRRLIIAADDLVTRVRVVDVICVF